MNRTKGQVSGIGITTKTATGLEVKTGNSFSTVSSGNCVHACCDNVDIDQFETR